MVENATLSNLLIPLALTTKTSFRSVQDNHSKLLFMFKCLIKRGEFLWKQYCYLANNLTSRNLSPGTSQVKDKYLWTGIFFMTLHLILIIRDCVL